MSLMKYLTTGLALLLLLGAGSVSAHSFGQSYTLPVPVWLYLYGAAATLVISFAMVGYFVGAKAGAASHRRIALSRWWRPDSRLSCVLFGLLRGLSVALLALAIVSGFIGNQNAYRNINMTLFWVWFVLGFTYLTVLLGNWYTLLSPFRVLADGLERILRCRFQGVYVYPPALSYWPGLAFYLVFIWLELFGRASPLSLSVILSVYTAINLLGCWLIGKDVWFKYGEIFAVFLGLVAKIAPVHCEYNTAGRVKNVFLQRPFSGLYQKRPVPFSLLVFVLFMLSSTAFDGLHETALWVGGFWKNLYQLVLFPIYGSTPPVTLPTIRKLFLVYQSGALILSPFVYLGLYALFLLIGGRLLRYGSPRDLLTWFAYSLIPIVFAYHFTHYYTLLQIQGPQMLRLMSDPLGIGWNLFGTAQTVINIVPDMGRVWHTQVAVIVAGHIVSVYLAHRQALVLFPDRRAAMLSQLPVLVLMVIFTSVGLWILSLPLNPGELG
jgi:hypothetical protein